MTLRIVLGCGRVADGVCAGQGELWQRRQGRTIGAIGLWNQSGRWAPLPAETVSKKAQVEFPTKKILNVRSSDGLG
jgi:hypothetical protein